MTNPDVTAFFDPATFTVTYLVRDPGSVSCALIDSVLDYDPASGRTSAEALVAHVQQAGLQVEWCLETHLHADHLSAAPFLQQTLGGKTAIGAQVTEVQETFGTLFNAEATFARDGSQFDVLFREGETFAIGGLTATVLHTPGHTPACLSYHIGDAVFVGDTLFMPDFGTARCDFPGGSAARLYHSIQRLLALPPETRMFVGHDYAPEGRPYAWETTVAEQHRHNIHVRDGITAETFITQRQERDAGLDLPRLLLPAVQVNMRAGALPPPEDNGLRYLKIPLNQL